MLRRVIQIIGKRCYSDATPHKTALYDFHVKHGGRMVVFAGYSLPIQYKEGIPESHKHTRSHASLFDVSHMLQTIIRGKDRVRFIESITTADVQGMGIGTGCLSLFTDAETGGILDDLIVTKYKDYIYLVTNASRKDSDIELILEAQEKLLNLGGEVSTEFREDRSLIALQGPQAASALQGLVKHDLSRLYFMNSTETEVCGKKCLLSRAGYTGEDGFEISLQPEYVEEVAETLIAQPGVKLAGLGARDSLRLEAGLCLYGNDIDINTTPASAGLMWTIGKRRKECKDFPGSHIILSDKPKTKRFGLTNRTGPPVRGGAILKDGDGDEVGRVTSGCPSPVLGGNIAMGYLPATTKPGDMFISTVRGKDVTLQVVKMPFLKTNYYLKSKASS